MPYPSAHELPVRRTLRDGDEAAISALHDRVYRREYGLNDTFVGSVADGVRRARAAGWPQTGGGVWLLDGTVGLLGALALTRESAELGRVRWFVLDVGLRGRGLGGRMLRELLARAYELGFAQLELETFSALHVAARLYRAVGFQLVSETPRTDFGAPITFQRYELTLR